MQELSIERTLQIWVQSKSTLMFMNSAVLLMEKKNWDKGIWRIKIIIKSNHVRISSFMDFAIMDWDVSTYTQI